MKSGRHSLVVQPRVWIRGCSQLADKLGVTRTHMSMIMHGTRRPGRSLAARLRRLGVTWPAEGVGEPAALKGGGESAALKGGAE